MKKYKVRINKQWSCEAEIEEVEVERETDKSVWIDGRRNMKESDWANYYDTWEEAHSNLLNQQRSHVASVEGRFKYAFKVLTDIEAMKP